MRNIKGVVVAPTRTRLALTFIFFKNSTQLPLLLGINFWNLDLGQQLPDMKKKENYQHSSFSQTMRKGGMLYFAKEILNHVYLDLVASIM